MTRSRTDRLAIGTAQFGSAYGIANQTGQPDADQVRAILDTARDAGVITIDTAILYGEGASETVLGKAGTAGFNVVSKLPPAPPDCRDIASWVHEQTEASIARLNVRQLHGLLLHAPAQLHDASLGPELYAALIAVQDSKLTRKIGVSVYAPDELDTILRIAPSVNLVQAPCNIIDRRMITSGWADRLNAAGIELHTRSAFLQGLLLMTPEARPAAFGRWSALFAVWDTWLAEQQIDALTACLKFLLSFPAIDRIIVGVEKVTQLDAILRAAATDFAVRPPDSLASEDPGLINPANWSPT